MDRGDRSRGSAATALIRKSAVAKGTGVFRYIMIATPRYYSLYKLEKEVAEIFTSDSWGTQANDVL